MRIKKECDVTPGVGEFNGGFGTSAPCCSEGNMRESSVHMINPPQFGSEKICEPCA